MKKSTVLTVLAALMGLLALGLFISCGEKLSETPTSPQVSKTLNTETAETACHPDPVFHNDGPGGNVDCSEGYLFSSGRLDIDQDANPQGGTAGPISWEISADGKSLSWSGNHCGLAVIVKGGPGANVYEYGEECTSDNGLISPPVGQGNTPEISNITFCWNECPDEHQGCTPGYWKNHTDSWEGFSPSDKVKDVFTIPGCLSSCSPLGDATLLEALSFGGGKTDCDAARLLVHHAVAALLNAGHSGVNYPRTTADIISDVNSALASCDRGTMLDLKDELDADNNLGCPLN